MAIDYAQNVIGSSAYSALAKKRGINGESGSVGAVKINAIATDVQAILTACEANATLAALSGTATAGDQITQALRGATESVFSGVDMSQFTDSSPVSLSNAALSVLALYVACKAIMDTTAGGSGIANDKNAVISAAFSALSTNRGTSGIVSSATTGGVYNDSRLQALVVDVTAVLTAYNASTNSVITTIRAAEYTAGTKQIEALRGAVEAVFNNQSVDLLTPTEIVALFDVVSLLYTPLLATMGTNLGTNSIASSAFSSLAAQRGISNVTSATDPRIDSADSVFVDLGNVLSAYVANSAFVATIGAPTEGAPAVQAARAAFESVFTGLDITAQTSAELASIITVCSTLYNSSIANMGPVV